MINLEQVLTHLSDQLEKNLPGEKAQYKMAPDFREIRIANAQKNKNNYIQSGVLILLYEKFDDLHICFIKRPEYKGPHSGQVSFPGGKFEKGDIDLIHTALRETYEEIGVLHDNVSILGSLSKLKIPVSLMEVLPVVGYSEFPPLFRINSKEVKYLIEVKVNHLLEESNRKEMTLFLSEGQLKAPYYAYKNEKIWGATAMMLSEFLEVYKMTLKCPFPL